MVSSHEPKGKKIPEWITTEFVHELRSGGTPDIQEFASRLPELSEEIVERLRHLLMVEQVRESLSGKNNLTGIPILEQILDYQIRSVIGHGAMGVVYRAFQPRLNRTVAIKVLHGERNDLFPRFRREAQMISRLHHPNIVQLFDYDVIDGAAFLIMQYVDGVGLNVLLDNHTGYRSGQHSDGHQSSEHAELDSFSVASHMKDTGKVANADETERLPSKETPGGTLVGRDFLEISRLGSDVAQALQHAHDHGIIHRDVKPANLLLGRDGRIRVADFGLAKDQNDERMLSHAGELLGTPRYMSPEQMRGMPDARCDIYALGITLWELTLGRRAWDADGTSGVLALPEPARLNADVPAELSRIISKCCRFAPAERYQTGSALSDDLLLFLKSETRQHSTSGQLKSERNKFLKPVCLIAFIVTALLTGIVALHSPDSEQQIPQALFLSEDTLAIDENLTEVIFADQLFGHSPGEADWQLGGEDQNLFKVTGRRGMIAFVTPPDFERPTDVQRDSIYEITISSAMDGLADRLGKAISIRVNDVVETPSLPGYDGSRRFIRHVRDGQTTIDLRDFDLRDLNSDGFTARIIGGRDADLFRIDLDTQMCVSKPDVCAAVPESEIEVDLRIVRNAHSTWASIQEYDQGKGARVVFSNGVIEKEFDCRDSGAFNLSQSVGFATADGRLFFSTVVNSDGTVEFWQYSFTDEGQIEASECLSRDCGLPSGVEGIATMDGSHFYVAGYRNRRNFSVRKEDILAPRYLWSASLAEDHTFTLLSEEALDVAVSSIVHLLVTDDTTIRIAGRMDGRRHRWWRPIQGKKSNRRLHQFPMGGREFEARCDWVETPDESSGLTLRLTMIPQVWDEYGATGKTIPGGAVRHVEFLNSSRETLVLYCAEQESTFVQIDRCNPGGKIILNTYVGRSWEVRSEDKTLWDAFTVFERMTAIVVERPREINYRSAW